MELRLRLSVLELTRYIFWGILYSIEVGSRFSCGGVEEGTLYDILLVLPRAEIQRQNSSCSISGTIGGRAIGPAIIAVRTYIPQYKDMRIDSG